VTKVLCLVSHGLYKPWIDIYNRGQKDTWLATEMPENFEVAHFHGSPVGRLGLLIDKWHERIRWSNRPMATSLRVVDRALGFPFRSTIPRTTPSDSLASLQQVWHVHQPDLYPTYKWKEIGILAHAIDNYEFDYLFTTTTSSYILPNNLLKVIANKPRELYYGGMIPYENANFASGSNRFFSRDVVELLVKNRKFLDCGIIEDVSIANLLQKYDILPDSLFGLNLDSLNQIENLTSEQMNLNYHYRLKSGPLSKRNDVELFKKLHEKLTRDLGNSQL
jgi:hypothetical protein